MGSLKEVRNRIESVKSTQQITRAMKMVAAAKLKRAQNAIVQMRPYARKMNDMLGNLASDPEILADNPYTQERTVQNVLVINVTSDKGLCGAFNNNINKSVQHLAENEYQGWDADKFHLFPIGKKGYEYFKKRDYVINNDYVDLFDRLDFENARQAVDYILHAFATKEYDKVYLVYNEFKNAATQIVRCQQFLPFIKEEEQEQTQKAKEANNQEPANYIFEPSKEAIIEDLVPRTLRIQFYKALLESNASEHGARMTAMDNATENAGDLIRELRLTYNRTRQAAITKEILEIVSGAEALAQS